MLVQFFIFEHLTKRDIKRGEHISTDYATFSGENMESFDCHCGAVDCRKVVTGLDYLQPFFNKYGERVSDYVLSKRRAKMGSGCQKEKFISEN
jgi:hypothetical protein